MSVLRTTEEIRSSTRENESPRLTESPLPTVESLDDSLITSRSCVGPGSLHDVPSGASGDSSVENIIILYTIHSLGLRRRRTSHQSAVAAAGI